MRSLFLRGLAIVYLIAFASALTQIVGLAGADGISPAHAYPDTLRSEYGANAYTLFPTIAWLNSGDMMLRAIPIAGIAVSILLFMRILPFPSTLALFALYMSVVTVGQDFYSFQWDTLLLETGFAALLLAPPGLRPSYKEPPSPVALWVFRFLIFRLMFESGAVKLLSGDPAWRNLTALTYHYETQPLPTPLAWYAHQLPVWFHKASVAGVFFVELIVPFFFFTTRRLRMVAACLTIGLQLAIALTGNYTFFNLLTILLCMSVFEVKQAERSPWNIRLAGAVLLAVGVFQLGEMFGIAVLRNVLSPITVRAESFHLVNRYGLFAVMTTSRNEIVIEGSSDGKTWQAYEFKYKPGDVGRSLPWIAPLQPRLDWQMWFAALGTYQQSPWFENFCIRLLEGSPEVIRLLDRDPFGGRPPKYVRGVLYQYHFADAAAHRASGVWWTRQRLGDFSPVISLPGR